MGRLISSIAYLPVAHRSVHSTPTIHHLLSQVHFVKQSSPQDMTRTTQQVSRSSAIMDYDEEMTGVSSPSADVQSVRSVRTPHRPKLRVDQWFNSLRPPPSPEIQRVKRVDYRSPHSSLSRMLIIHSRTRLCYERANFKSAFFFHKPAVIGCRVPERSIRCTCLYCARELCRIEEALTEYLTKKETAEVVRETGMYYIILIEKLYKSQTSNQMPDPDVHLPLYQRRSPP